MLPDTRGRDVRRQERARTGGRKVRTCTLAGGPCLAYLGLLFRRHRVSKTNAEILELVADYESEDVSHKNPD